MVTGGIKSVNQTQAMSEDDASKKNTDCVYFLASPLTCKKGSECEYRHSEHARVNPRDCWYWLNGSCLNPKCAFRHPPLDGLLGSQSAVSDGAAFPLPQAAAPSPLAALQPKQPVPCIFFQKGLCLKGDKCAFLHGPNVTTKLPQMAQPTSEITGPKSVFGISQVSAQERKLYQPNISNKYTDANSDPKRTSGQTKANEAKRGVLSPRGFGDRSSVYKASTDAPLSNGVHQLEIAGDYIMHNGKEADDVYRESSPGFDVLVDDELAPDQFYDLDQYGGTRGDHQGRHVDADPEMLHDSRGYDVHDELESQQARYKNRRSSDRISRGMDSVERWNDRSGGSSERIGQSDLRNRLKLKKESDFRSVISNDFAHNNRERRSGDSRRDYRPVAPLEGSFSSRLQGRVKDSRRSPMRGSVSGRDFEMGRNRSRTSPARNQIHDRIGSRVQDEFGRERHLRGCGMREEESEDGHEEFSGPKRLSDLKSKPSVKDRLLSGQESFSLGKRKSTGEHEQLNSDLSFDGPMPLSEILKRKKRSEVNASVIEPSENRQADKTEISENVGTNKEDYMSVTTASEKKTEPTDNLHPSEATKTNTNQNDQEGEILTEEAMEDQNLEGYEQGEDGEEYYYYEEDAGEYNLEEGENIEGGEYVEVGDGNDL